MNEEIYNAVADIASFTFFVFVAPGKEISEGFKVFANFGIGVEKVFNEILRYLDCPDGIYAVFMYFAKSDSYFYFKTIKYRRKSFALLIDSE